MVEKIKELCKKQGISISRLEKEVGLGNGTIGKWEKFNRRPKYESLKSIANVLDVSISELTGDEQKENPTLVSEDGLDATQTELVRLFKSAPPALRAAALAVLRSAEDQSKVPDGTSEAE